MADTVPKPKKHLTSKAKLKCRRGFRYALYAVLAGALALAPIPLAPYIWAEPTIPAVSLSELMSPMEDYANSVAEAADSVLRIAVDYHIEAARPQPDGTFDWESARSEIVETHGSGTVVSCQEVSPAEYEVTVDEDGNETRTMVKRPTYRILVLTAQHVIDAHAFDIYRNVRVLSVDIKAVHREGYPTIPDGVTVFEHDMRDIAVVSFLTDTPFKAVKLADEAPELASDLFIIGYGGRSGSYGDQWISRGLSSGDDRVTCPGTPGDSGGALLTPDALLVGVVSQIEVTRLPWSPLPQAINHHIIIVPTTNLFVYEWTTSAILTLHKTDHPTPEPPALPPIEDTDNTEEETTDTDETESPHDSSPTGTPSGEEPKAPSKDTLGPLGPFSIDE